MRTLCIISIIIVSVFTATAQISESIESGRVIKPTFSIGTYVFAATLEAGLEVRVLERKSLEIQTGLHYGRILQLLRGRDDNDESYDIKYLMPSIKLLVGHTRDRLLIEVGGIYAYGNVRWEESYKIVPAAHIGYRRMGKVPITVFLGFPRGFGVQVGF